MRIEVEAGSPESVEADVLATPLSASDALTGPAAALDGSLGGLLARLVEHHPEVAELDLNPVLAGPERCVAVDARVRLRRPSRAPSLKTW